MSARRNSSGMNGSGRKMLLQISQKRPYSSGAPSCRANCATKSSRLDQAALEAVHQLAADAPGNLRRRMPAHLLQRGVAAAEIERDEGLSQVENNGFEIYHIPISFHQPNPTVDQMARFTSETTNPIDHHFAERNVAGGNRTWATAWCRSWSGRRQKLAKQAKAKTIRPTGAPCAISTGAKGRVHGQDVGRDAGEAVVRVEVDEQRQQRAARATRVPSRMLPTPLANSRVMPASLSALPSRSRPPYQMKISQARAVGSSRLPTSARR